MRLPPIENFYNPWESYIEHIYSIFTETILTKNPPLTFNGLPIYVRKNPETKNKPFCFWHLISEGEKEDDRTPNFQRCEKIRWISWCIENINNKDSGLSWWINKRNNKKNIVIWHEQENFAVILGERNNYYLLLTSYTVENNRRKTFIKNRESFYNSKKPIPL